MSESLLEGYLHRRCGGRYASATETVTVRVSGMAATVERALFRCDRCGDERRTVEQRENAERAAVAEMRATHGLLAPKEIRQLRERLGLTTQQLGELLYGIPRGVVEGWERGRYLQNPQVDALLRSLEDRETLEQRAARAGVTLPVPEDPNAPRGEGGQGGQSAPAAADATDGDNPTSDTVGRESAGEAGNESVDGVALSSAGRPS
ncbi:MAG TPA: type II TA system antitoxin MqsA family protein [Gemmatimonadaceae bacterium]|nr:type II TA system antitoxin MqsA family protein [Gemmatimonadaceae bacterium]